VSIVVGIPAAAPRGLGKSSTPVRDRREPHTTNQRETLPCDGLALLYNFLFSFKGIGSILFLKNGLKKICKKIIKLISEVTRNTVSKAH
jgi:hypothetical protein